MVGGKQTLEAAYQQATSVQRPFYDEDRSPALIAGTVVVMVLAIVTFCLRCYAQKLIGKAKGIDTVFLSVGLLFSIASSAVTIAAVVWGLGKHQVRVKEEDPNAPWNLIRIFQAQFVLQLLQTLALLFTKLAILAYFTRVFTMLQPAFRWSVYVTTACAIIVGVGSCILFLNMCKPINYFWDAAWLSEGMPIPFKLEGDCLLVIYRLVAPLAADLLSDILILLLPIIGLWKLKMSKRRKLGLLFAFSLGAFVCITNVFRLVSVLQVQDAFDLSWEEADISIWTAVQCSVGVCAASVPGIAPLYRQLFPRRESVFSSQRSEDRRWFGSKPHPRARFLEAHEFRGKYGYQDLFDDLVGADDLQLTFKDSQAADNWARSLQAIDTTAGTWRHETNRI